MYNMFLLEQKELRNPWTGTKIHRFITECDAITR